MSLFSSRSSRPPARASSRARATLFGLVGVASVTFASACGLIAGLEDHRALPDGFPDSSSVPCTDGTKLVSCAGLPEAMRQDGSYRIAPPVRKIDGDLVVDAVTGLSWWRVTTPGKTWGDAEALCKSLDIQGLRGFRLPNRIELASILDIGPAGGTWLDKAFQNPGKLGYWSAVNANDTDPWVVFAACDHAAGCKEGIPQGAVASDWNGNAHDVLCVHGEPYEVGPFVQEGIFLKDETTKLVWTVDSSNGGTWLEALANCEASTLGGKQDWRLPSVKELLTLVDPKRPGNNSLFEAFKLPNPESSIWTSTPDPGNPTRAFFMLTAGGGVFTDDATKIDYYQAFCVRGPEP